MKSISEILGGMQMLLELSFDLQACFEEYLTADQRTFLVMLRVIEEKLKVPYREGNHYGRPAYKDIPIIRAFLAKSFFRILTIDDLRKRLCTDPNLRMICGFGEVPSLATFSRRLKNFSEAQSMAQCLERMVTDYYADRIVGHISRDSTAIAVREKPYNKKSDVAIRKVKNHSRDRPRKGEQRPQKCPTVVE